jgi:basic membrane lipoprotein Med (substrate-binding protein (PBP1-ABC) superfamily)
VLLVGCGGDDSSSGTPTGDTSEGTAATPSLKIAWLFYGPKDDGGYNLSIANTQAPLEATFGDQIENVNADNVPYSEEAAQIAQGFVDDGANLLIDSMGLAEIFTDVCADNPDIHCIEIVPAGELPENTTGHWMEPWIAAYQAGVIAGLSTTSNTVGFVSPGEFPVTIGGANGFAMGCQKVNSDCNVRVVSVNDYFNPPASSQAANSLVDAGADVLFGWVDDPSFCAVAEDRDVLAVGMYVDMTSACPNAITTSLEWNFESFYESQISSILDGTWKQEDLVVVPAKEFFSLGPWGPNVPADVQEQSETTWSQLTSGELNPFVGPLSDNKGKVRVEDGVEMSYEDLYGWDWYVDGVIAGN